MFLSRKLFFCERNAFLFKKNKAWVDQYRKYLFLYYYYYLQYQALIFASKGVNKLLFISICL